jgi:tRNA-dihydrouridine synthase A
MQEPERVADCVAGMRDAVRVPVTVKMRIGVVTAAASHARREVAGFGEREFERLCRFVRSVCEAGCAVAIVHARQAVLGGLSPKDNREVPPLRYDVVRRLKSLFASLPVVVNGGLRERAAVLDALTWCDGVMLGREAYHRPYLLAELQQALRPTAGGVPTREALLARMQRYAERELAAGERLGAITRHMLGLYSGQPGARDYRRTLSEGARQPGADPGLLCRAIPGFARA